MALSKVTCVILLLVVAAVTPSAVAQLPSAPPAPTFRDTDYFQLALNLEYLEAEFYLYSVYGYGVDGVNKSLTGGGPPSVGGKKAKLSSEIFSVAQQLALQEVGHIRIIREYLGNQVFPRPQINIGSAWVALFDAAYGVKLSPSFDPYANDKHWLLAAYALPYVGLTAYVGTNPNLVAVSSKKLLAGVLGVEGGQDALLRTLLWTQKSQTVTPYKRPVSFFTGIISALRIKLDGSKVNRDENIVVPKTLGAEHLITDNILSANGDSLSFARNPRETIAIIYGTGNAAKPGGFFPDGANGVIARYYRKHSSSP